MMNPNMFNNMNMGMNQNQMINPMNFNNQMGMNNFMGMKNFLNDTTAFQVKNLIGPYEEKIKELEEKLRQKEFEIACLKSKLNEKSGNRNIMMDQMIMNQMNQMNQMYQMNQMMIANPIMMKLNDDDPRIELIFEEKGNENWPKRIKCSYDELIISVINKYCVRNGVNKDDCKFIYNGKKINENLTVAESGLGNSSKINVIKINDLSQNNLNENNIIKGKNYLNIYFTSDSGYKMNFICSTDETWEDVIKKFCKRRNEKYNKSLFDKYTFICHSDKISNYLKKKIGEYFLFQGDLVILVYQTKNLIGN